MIARLCAAALALLAWLPATTAPALASTHLDNVEGIAIDREGKVRRFAGMVIDDDGRVKELLQSGERPRERVDYRQDMRGRVIVPGFIDSHVHLMATGLATLSLDLSDTRSLAEALERVAQYSARYPNRPWIVGRGWNQEAWGLGRFPTAAELDAVSDRPVILERVDGHAVWVNSAALAAAGITRATPDPAGGRILRQPGSREVEGVLVDNAMALVRARVPVPLAGDRDLAFHAAQQKLLSQGVTGAADMGTTIEDWMTYRRAGDAGRLRLRIMAYATSVPEMLLIGGTGPTLWLYEDRLRLNGIKLFLDGALGSRGALLKRDYADDPGNRGLSLMDGTQLRNSMSRAAMDGFQIAIHAIGDAANQEALHAIEELADDFPGDRRWRIEHAQVVDPADMPLFARHGVIASMQPVHQTSDRLMAEARLGPSGLVGAYAWRSLTAVGATLAFGSDTPVERPDPIEGIAVAISRTDAAGQPSGGWQAQETVSRETALAAYTSAAAHAGFAEGRFGSLAVGERADFAVLSGDPLMLDAQQIRAIGVLETWIGGQRVWRRDDDSEPSPGGR